MGPIPISVGHSASLGTVRMQTGQKNEKKKIKIQDKVNVAEITAKVH